MLWMCVLGRTAGTDIHDNDQLSQLNERRKPSERGERRAVGCRTAQLTDLVILTHLSLSGCNCKHSSEGHDGSSIRGRISDLQLSVYTAACCPLSPLTNISLFAECIYESQTYLPIELIMIRLTTVCMSDKTEQCWEYLAWLPHWVPCTAKHF